MAIDLSSFDTTFDELKSKHDLCLKVLSESECLNKHFLNEHNESMNELIGYGNSLGGIKRYQTSPLQVGVIGHTNSGKSTLVNALLGISTASKGRQEGQKLPVAYNSGIGEKERWVMVDQTGKENIIGKTVWSEYEKNSQGPDIEKAAYLGCDLESANWKPGLVIWDTPGLEGSSDYRLLSVLGAMDAFIWVVMEDHFRDANLLEMGLKRIRMKEYPLMVVVNCQSACTEEEYQRFPLEVRKAAGLGKDVPCLVIRHKEILEPSGNIPVVNEIRKIVKEWKDQIDKPNITISKLKRWQLDVYEVGEKLREKGLVHCGTADSIQSKLADIHERFSGAIRSKVSSKLDILINEEHARFNAQIKTKGMKSDSFKKSVEEFTGRVASELDAEMKKEIRYYYANELSELDWNLQCNVPIDVFRGMENTKDGKTEITEKYPFLGGIAGFAVAAGADVALDGALDYLLSDALFGFGAGMAARWAIGKYKIAANVEKYDSILQQIKVDFNSGIEDVISEIEKSLSVQRKTLEDAVTRKTGVNDVTLYKRELETLRDCFYGLLEVKLPTIERASVQEAIIKRKYCENIFEEYVRPALLSAQKTVVIHANYIDWEDIKNIVDVVREREGLNLEIFRLFVGKTLDKDERIKYENTINDIRTHLETYATKCNIALYKGVRKRGGPLKTRKILVDRTKFGVLYNEPRPISAVVEECEISKIEEIQDEGERKIWLELKREMMQIEEYLSFPATKVFESSEAIKTNWSLAPSPYLRYGMV